MLLPLLPLLRRKFDVVNSALGTQLALLRQRATKIPIKALATSIMESTLASVRLLITQPLFVSVMGVDKFLDLIIRPRREKYVSPDGVSNLEQENEFLSKRIAMRGQELLAEAGAYSAEAERKFCQVKEDVLQTQFNVIDAKATALINHTSVLVAVIVFALSKKAETWVDRFIEITLSIDLIFYLFALLLCLMCVNILGPTKFPGSPIEGRLGNLSIFQANSRKRRETYRRARRLLVFATFPLLLDAVLEALQYIVIALQHSAGGN